MQGKSVTLIGATGLVGGHMLQLLQNDPGVNIIHIPVRRNVAFTQSKAKPALIDFACEADLRNVISGSEAVFVAVGTTQKKVKGDKSAYRKVDVDIPVGAAKVAASEGVKQFLLVSSIGASAQSNNFYLRLKGEVEETVRNLSIPSVSIFQPSMLLGQREEIRTGERIGQALMRTFSFLIPSKYKPVKARDVAGAMVSAFHKNAKGFHIYQYKEILQLAIADSL